LKRTLSAYGLWGEDELEKAVSNERNATWLQNVDLKNLGFGM